MSQKPAKPHVARNLAQRHVLHWFRRRQSHEFMQGPGCNGYQRPKCEYPLLPNEGPLETGEEAEADILGTSSRQARMSASTAC